MKSALFLLVLLLGAQLGLAWYLTLREPTAGVHDAEARLFALAADEIDRISIEEPERPPLELVRQGNVWRLPQFHDFPITSQRVSQFMDSLAQLKRGWPVATSADAAERFKTTDSEYVRRISFFAGEAVRARLYFGSSPGFRQSHARVDGEHAVYALAFNSFDASTGAEDWIDRDLLKLDASKIDAIQLGEIALQRSAEGWTLAARADDETPQSGAIAHLVERIADQTFMEVLGRDEHADYGLHDPKLQIDLILAGQVIALRYGQPENASYYVLKSSAHPFYFKLAELSVERLRKAERADLIEKPAPDTVPTDETRDK
ncbi:MAG: DUF4340 domain-containing protein [Thiotrichales bacterium]